MKKIRKLALTSLAIGSMFFAGCSNYTSSTLSNEETGSRSAIAAATEEDDSWKKDVMYFLFVDRFYDGNTSNNTGHNAAQYDASKSNWKKYWGGDLAGLNEKLDYLKDMGINSIWVTPLVDGIDVLTKDGDAPYHGYWAHDFYNIDEHLGTWDEFDALVNKMHSDEYGMRLCLDYAPNHTNPNDTAEYGALYQTLYDGAGNVSGRKTVLNSYNNDYSGIYHHNGGVSDWDNYYQVVNHNLFNLSDLNQSNSTVYNYLADALAMWLKRGVDEVRVDAVKHMDIDFTKNLVNDMQNRLGKKIFFFGEWAGAGAQNYSTVDGKAKTLENTTDCNLLDFGYRQTVEDVLLGNKDVNALAQYLTDRESYFVNPGKQVVFLDNHDMSRINTTLRHSGHMSPEMAAKKTDIGLVLTMTVRGVPCIYYGTENYDANFTDNGMNQIGGDPYNRNMMTSFAGNTNAYNIIKVLANLRQTNAALQDGRYEERWKDESVLAFQRINGDDVVVTFINNSGSDRNMTIPNINLKTGKYYSVIGRDEVTVNNTTATVRIPANSGIVISGKVNNNGGGVVPPVGNGSLTIKVKSSCNSESIYFPGDYNGWSLNANNINVGSYSESSFTVNNAVTSATLASGDNKNTLELKLVTSASWDNQWNFRNWSTSSNISFADNYRQINIACSAGNNVTLIIDIANLSITAEVK